jgi:hypothetical protein
VVLRAKHPLARIGTARKSLAPAATRSGSASRSPLLNVSTERFHPDLGACAHGLTGVRFDRLAADRPFYSGKHHRHGMNLQVIAAPDGEIVGVSGPLPGAVHDLTAARNWGIIRRLVAAGPVTLATKLPGGRRPHHDPVQGQNKPASQKDANRGHAKLRGPRERANAQLKIWRILRKLRCCP